MPEILPIIILVACGLWGWAVGTGRGGVRLSMFVAGLGLVLDLAATIGWLSADIGIAGLFIAAIAGGTLAIQGRRNGWHWPWRGRQA